MLFLCVILASSIFCLTAPISFAQTQGEKIEIVNRQMDMVENSLANAQGPSRLKVESPSAGSMLKSIFNSDLFPTPRPRFPSEIKTRVHTFDLGVEVFYYHYEEPDLKVRIFGPMYGDFAGYTYRPAAPSIFNNFLVNVYSLQARSSYSRVLGYRWARVTERQHDDVNEFRGLIGKDYFIGRDALATPYFGFGYRYLKDRGNGEANIVGGTLYYGYDRKSHYYYLPVGCDLRINVSKDWEIDPNIEYDILLQGWQKSFLSDGNQFGADNTDVANHQDKGYGLRGSVKFLKRGARVDFYVEPYFRFWHIADSQAAIGRLDGETALWEEPDNNTIEAGTKFGVQF